MLITATTLRTRPHLRLPIGLGHALRLAMRAEDDLAGMGGGNAGTTPAYRATIGEEGCLVHDRSSYAAMAAW